MTRQSYNGKSTGAGSLSIWTHHLKDIHFFDYRDDHYAGKAYRIGAGVQGIELYEAGNKAGLTVVSCECPMVGVAGVYIQGGGHSAQVITKKSLTFAAAKTLKTRVQVWPSG